MEEVVEDVVEVDVEVPRVWQVLMGIYTTVSPFIFIWVRSERPAYSVSGSSRVRFPSLFYNENILFGAGLSRSEQGVVMCHSRAG